MVTPIENNLHVGIPTNPAKSLLRYAVQIRDRGKPICVVVVRLEVGRFVTPNRIREMLNKKIVNYISARWPGQLGMGAVISGRVDHEIQ